MSSATEVLSDHPFFASMEPRHVEVLARCARPINVNAGDLLFRQGTPAEGFYLLRSGRIALEVFNLATGPITVQTLGEGEVVGWSWIVAPHDWRFDARALERLEALQLDGACLRALCDEDPSLGYQLMQRFAAVMSERLEATRLQLARATGFTP